MSIRTPTQAVEYATRYLASGYNGYCLAHVQDAYNAKPVYASAIEAWNNSRHKHPTTNLAAAPFGAPIYWYQSGNPYGHIAIHLKGDSMYTTDSGAGYPHTDSIQKWQNQYGYQPLGWTEDIENQLIPQLGDDEDMPSAQEIAAAVWSYVYDKNKSTTYNQLQYTLTPENIAQAVWGFKANNNPQPNMNCYEQLKTAGQVSGFAFTVNDETHNNGKTIYWLNTATFVITGFSSWNEWEVWCKCMHMPTDKYAKLTAEEWKDLSAFIYRPRR